MLINPWSLPIMLLIIGVAVLVLILELRGRKK
jgi:hypothetical protein